MNLQQRVKYLRTMIATIGYKPDWTFRFIAAVDAGLSIDRYDGAVEITSAHTRDAEDGSDNGTRTRRIVPIGSDQIEDVVNNIFGELMAFEIHEAQEWFSFNGRRLMNPHKLPAR